MGAVKDAFHKIGEGVKNVAKGVGHAVEGAVKTAEGVLTANPKLLKEGANTFKQGLQQGISGVGQVAGGTVGAAIGLTPVGAAINHMTNGAASRLGSGIFEGAAKTLNRGIDGATDLAGHLAKGDLKNAGKDLWKIASAASMTTPVGVVMAGARTEAMDNAKGGLGFNVSNDPGLKNAG